MSKDWRGYRLLTIGDKRFRWTISFSYPVEKLSVGYATQCESWPVDQLLVRLEAIPHMHLKVNWPACTGPLVVPSLVRMYIDEAISRGWLSLASKLELSGIELQSLESIF